LEKLRVLSDEEIVHIHEASLDILEETGVEIGGKRMFDFLRGKGFPAELGSGIVRFPRERVMEELGKIPASFEIFDREGRLAFVLGDGAPKIAAGHNAVFWVDGESGETRPSGIADVELFARICEELPAINMIGIPVMPQDAPDPKLSLLHAVRACVTNSRKPIFFSTDQPNINRHVMEMLRAAFKGDMSSQAYGICQLSPTSPLFWEGGVLEAIADTVVWNVPLAILPEPNAGVSAPYTLAGLLTMNNAECLSGLVMAQLLHPGAKVMYANSWTTTDMRNGYALVGSSETTICRIAGAQLARFYKVPSHTTAPNSDNHAHDEQNAWEKSLSQFCAIGAGNDLIVNCGMFATGMTCSHEQLIMDEEISAIALRIARGITVDDATIAKDVITELGPHNPSYLTAEHTMKWLHSDEYEKTRVSVRQPRALWEASGSRDAYQLSNEKVREFAARPAAAPLTGARLDRVDAILREAGMS
jgi:trimethylamine--corrinoid protein Co-methyltransferase